MKKSVAIILLLVIVHIVLAQVPIPTQKNIPPPPTPSFGEGQTTSAQTPPATTTQPPASSSAPQSSSNRNRGSVPAASAPSQVEVPGIIDTSALQRVQSSPEVQAPQEVQSNDALRQRIASLENEIAIIKSDIAAMKANQGNKDGNETSYWQIAAILGILLVLALIVKEALILIKKKSEQKSEVEEYIRKARSAGVPDEEIIRRLVIAGWDEMYIRQLMR